MSGEIKDIKNKIFQWLSEEGFSPAEVEDQNTYFNFRINAGNQPLNIVQEINRKDSVIVGIYQALAQDLLNKLDDKKKSDYAWNAISILLSNNEIGDFALQPNPPNDLKVIFITSKRIFYDALTKDRLMSAITTVTKTIMRIGSLLQHYTGVSPSKSLTTPGTIQKMLT